MRDKPSSKDIPSRLRAWLDRAKSRGRKYLKQPKLKKIGAGLKGKVPGKLRDLDFDFKHVDFRNVSQYSGWIRWGLVVLALFLLAGISSGIVGLFIRPVYTALPRKGGAVPQVASKTPTEDYDAILRRNMFNVEGKIPEPFDQGQLDCMSQARPATNKVILLGTIVMNDERHSVALIQDEGSGNKIAVKKDDIFGDNRFVAMKVERKKLCFQVKASQEFEYVEIPEENLGLGTAGPSVVSGITTDGIAATSENEFVVKNDFLQKNLLNLNEILQTARAVPYIEPGTGKFRGFLVQSIDQNSPFAALGIRQGDILTGVNDVVFDNAGKGLEAFQRLRSANKISLEIIRGGQKQTMSYDVK